jgi:hypothetical protein
MQDSSTPGLISNNESLDEAAIRHRALCVITYFANGHFSQADLKKSTLRWGSRHNGKTT